MSSLLLPVLFLAIGAITGWAIMSTGLWFFFKSIPRRKASLDKELSKYIAEQFISFDEIEQKIISPENYQKIVPAIEAHIDNFLRHKLGKSMPMLSMFIGDKTINQLKATFMEELEELFPTVMKNYFQRLQQELDLEGVLHAKLAEIPPQHIEAQLKKLLAPELKKARIIGAVIGLVTSLIMSIVGWLMLKP